MSGPRSKAEIRDDAGVVWTKHEHAWRITGAVCLAIAVGSLLAVWLFDIAYKWSDSTWALMSLIAFLRAELLQTRRALRLLCEDLSR